MPRIVSSTSSLQILNLEPKDSLPYSESAKREWEQLCQALVG